MNDMNKEPVIDIWEICTTCDGLGYLKASPDTFCHIKRCTNCCPSPTVLGEVVIYSTGRVSRQITISELKEMLGLIPACGNDE